MKYLILGLIVLAGVGIPVQVAANHRMEQAVRSAALSATMTFAIGAVAMLLFTLSGALGRGNLPGAASAPWWAWSGGVIGVFAVLMSILGLPRVGAGTVIAATVFGQLIAAVVLDHFGWLGVPRTPVNGWRVAGALLLLLGTALIQRK